MMVDAQTWSGCFNLPLFIFKNIQNNNLLQKNYYLEYDSVIPPISKYDIPCVFKYNKELDKVCATGPNRVSSKAM